MSETILGPSSVTSGTSGDRAVPASIFVPSDFPLAPVTQAELDAVLAAQGGDDAVDDLYPLTPLQEGILFHALDAPGSGFYVEQLGVTLRGLDADAYVRAWQTVVDRHAALRTAFVAGIAAAPLQVVHREAAVPVRRLDWSDAGSEERSARLHALAEDDVRRGFDLAAPPLFRLTIVRTGDDEHRVLITFHHLVLDGWSAARVFAEMDAAYEAIRAGARPELPEPRPFRDYVAWLLRREPARAEAFWRREMAGFTPPELGLGTPRGAAGGDGEWTALLSAAETDAAQSLARAAGVTQNTVFEGALAILLSRYSGEDDVAFGAVSSGRDGELAGISDVVGMTINTLPVRARVGRDARAGGFLRELQARRIEAREHDQAPLHKIREWSGAPADRPLFEVLYAFENYPIDGGRDDDGEGAADARMVERNNYPLTVTVLPGVRTRIRLTWDAARIGADDGARIGAHLQALVAALAKDPEARVATLPLLGDRERAAVIEEWNATDRPLPAAPVHRLFAEWAERTPGAVALAFDGGTMTYAELHAAADRLARRLVAAGVRPEARVGVAVERSPELVVALLAVLRAGGAYVPLDAAYPPERLAYMAEDAGISALVVKDEVPAALAGLGARVVRLASDEPTPEIDLPEVDPQALAYVLYTSGSTGRPKGVAVPHRAVVRLARTGGFAELGPGEVVLHLAPAAFDVSTFELWGPLLNGATVAVHPAAPPAPAALGDFIRRHGVTTAWLTAGLFHHMVQAGPEHLRGLRQLMAGGDVLSPLHVARTLAALPGVRLTNGYGPTETTTFASCHDATSADADAGAIPIGRPIGNTRLYVLDREMRPVPAGVAGELFIGGAGVARGYLGRPALTAERFVPDPFGDGARVYRTGDRVRLSAANARTDGGRGGDAAGAHLPREGEPGFVLDFLGRLDGQMKVRGFRIEPAEVEAALESHPGVRAAAVAARDDGHGSSRLVAWVVPADDETPGPAELREHLAARLPVFMVPSAWVTVDALPLNANGKVDRRALPDPGAPAAGAHRPPRTATERALAAIWQEVLGREQVGAGDDFFLAGGHSLLATQVASRVRRELGVELPVRAVFDHPVLSDLAAHLDGGMEEEDDLPLAAPVPLEAPARPYLAPSTPTERALAEIWREVLGRDRVSADDDFFLVGGHSLLTTMVATRVRDRLGVEVPLVELFDRAVLADLAAWIDAPTPAAEEGEPHEASAPRALRTGRYLPPATDTERALAEIWGEVLGIDRVSADEDFFLAGGHSLLTAMVSTRARERLGVDLSPADVFDHPVLSDLAARADLLPRVDTERGAGRREEGDAPLSFAQERLWFIDRMAPGSSVYNVPQPMRIRGEVDLGALMAALRALVRRHAALRTRFALVEGRPVQRVEPADDRFAPGFHDLSTYSAHEREAEVARRVQEWSWAPFDLERGPLYRAGVLRLADDDHVVLLAMHHAVTDGWSMGVFRGELMALHRAFRRGEPSPLPDLPTTYAEFAAWQRERLTGEVMERQLAWWRATLAGAPAVLELPADRPRPARQTHRGAQSFFTVPAEVAREVRALAHRERSSLFMLLLAAWNVLMARLSGAADVVVGTPVAGRTRAEVEGVIGLFVNTLALRADLSGNPTFREVAARVRESTLGAFARQEVPFERLVEELRPERSLSHAPVFQVIFQLLNTPEGEPDEGLEVEHLGADLRVARMDLTAGVVEEPDGSLNGVMEYATDLFDAETVERFAAWYVALLRAAAAAPDTRIAALPLLSPAERERVVALGARVERFAPAGTLHGRFAARAAATPDAPALTFSGTTLTYREVDERANRLANHLRALGAGPERLVGLCVERSPETVIGMVAILKSGAAYLPLDPAYPEDRLAYMLGDSGARIVVTTAALASRLPADAGAIQVVRLDHDAAAIASASPASPEAAVDADGMAYVIYTSGSTGRPKGVQVTHANVLRLFAATEGQFGFGADDVWSLFHSYAFDFSVWEVWGALLHGGRVVVVPFFVSRSPEAFLRLLVDERVTMLSQTPGAFRELARADERAGTPALALRAVVFGGEALDPGTLRGWVERRGIGTPRLVNMYGITETTVHVTVRVISEDDVRSGGASPIGAALPDLSVHVLDANGEPAPAGVPGELHVGGAGVARGYLGRPALTAERFVPDPFASQPGARMYRSGDRARWTADGARSSADANVDGGAGDSGDAELRTIDPASRDGRSGNGRTADGSGSTGAPPRPRTFALQYLGRVDHQVKLRGFRIEPGEIEAVLRAHPSVRDAVVLPRGEGDAARLVAWTVAEGDPPPAAELRAHAAARLPDYMVPAAFVAIGALPLTRNGKVDARALPDPVADASAGRTPPRTPTEEVLAGAWAELLGVERVGVEDGFFALGGHSLLATRVVSRVRETFGVELPLRTVFEHPALGDLAAAIDRLRGAAPGADAPPVVPRPRDGDAPLSFAQERMWFVDRMEPGSSVYHMPFAFRVRGALDAHALRRALDAVAARHEALRTSFPLVDGAPVQRVHPAGPAELAVHDLSALPVDERDTAADEIARDAAERPFDVEHGPLFRAALVRRADDDHRLVINLHHLVSDGWSVGVLSTELAALYGAFRRGEPDPLPPLAVQYADFAAWQREWLAGEVLEAQLGYWRRKLAGAPPRLELPTDFPRPAVQRHRGRLERASIDGDAAAGVLRLARDEGATVFMTLLAAWSVVLARWAGESEVVVGTPIAGRTRAETEPLIGLFLNSLALRTDLAGDPSFRDLLARVRETTLEAYAHQDVPFERILEELKPERSLAHAPVFQAMLNLANFGDATLSLPGVEVEPEGAGAEIGSKLDLTLYASEWEGSLSLDLVYDAELFAPERMREMLAQLAAVLGAAAADPSRPVASFSLVTESARAALPDPATPLSAEWRGSVPALFARHAAAAPDAVAVEDPRERWTYAELAKGAGRIANALAEAKVGPGDVVAIWAHRSAALVRALLGTLQSGAAFLVLDPAYPPARLAAYCRAAAPRAFLRIAAAGPVPDAVADALDDSVRRAVTLGEKAERDGLFGVPAVAPEVEIGADAAAYLSFTSGTTGEPKAVIGRHGSLTHFTPWLAETFGLGAGDRFSLLSGLAHDPLHRDVFTPLQLGAAVVAPDPEAIGAPAGLAGWIGSAGVTVAHLTPALGQLLGAAGPAAGSLPALRRAFFVGDVLTRTDVERLHALAPALEVVNYYGSTETQRAVSFFPVPRPASLLPRETVPAGRGIPGVQLVVRTPAGAQAGVGEAGEIWMRSPHIALGYLGDPEMTAARFVPNPWTADEGDRMYRTGDLGRYRADGVVEVAGRADRQVKVRGFRIEPGEIEAALRAHPAVADAAVLARGEGDGRRLVAWVVARNASTENAGSDALRGHLAALLPEWMVPAAFVPLPALPLTPNGKLDRAALPDPEPAAAARVAPQTETERALAAIWTKLLGVDDVGIHDHFFHAGGHSLLAARLSAHVRAALQVELPLRTVFEHPTLAALAEAIDARRPRRDPEPEPAPAPAPASAVSVDAEKVYPVSFPQRRLWVLDRLQPGNAAYNMASGFRLRGRLDVGALERALGEIVARHETLRTRIETRDEEPVQVVSPPAPFHLPLLDRPGAGDDDLSALLGESAARPMELERGPLFRAFLVRVADDDHALFWTVHHAVSDGWSAGVMVGELQALYEAFAAGRPSPLPPLPVQYGEHAARERERLSGAALDELVEWWTGRLRGAPALLELPTDRPRPAVGSQRGAWLRFGLPAGIGARIDALARREACTPFMVLLAAYQAVLSRWSGQTDLVVGTPIAGRTTVEVEPLIGFFANTLALRGDLSGDPPFRELLARVRDATLGAYEHQELPFERLVEELRPERSMAHAPVVQAVLVLQNAPRAGGAGGGLGALRMEPVGRDTESAKFDLTVVFQPVGDEMVAFAEFATDLFDAETVERLAGHLATFLEGALATPGERISALPLMTDDERRRVLSASRAVAPAPAAGPTLHHAFAARAARAPHAVAVTCDGASLTYAELDLRANRVANHLRALGAGAGTLVGLCVERSVDTVVGIVAILKAGGAYLPLDPAYPRDRLAYTLADSGAALVVSTAAAAEHLPGSARLVLLDAHAAAIDAAGDHAPESGAGADSLAYVIYTSGSTGRPKGVGVTHGNVARLFSATGAWFGFGAGDVWTLFHSYAFDFSVWELWGALLYGGRLVVVPLWVARSPEAFHELLEREAVTVLNQTPSAFRQLAAVDEEAAAAGTVRSLALRHVIFGGEALDPASLRGWVARRGDSRPRLVNMYGITETTVHVTWRPLTADDVTAGGVSPIGVPIPDLGLYLLDPAGRPVPFGVAGEIHVSGAGVARGYLSRPALTAERFVPDPFSGVAGARMYRSGDLARRRVDGEVEYLGRADDQVKVRGFRIEPGEVEAAVAAHPGVRQAVVLPRPDPAGGTRLVAWYAPAGAGVSPADLRADLRERLPEHMVPAALVPVEAFALNPSGKVDRRALPDPGDEPEGFAPPSTPVEEVLAGIWAEVLRRERVGAGDDFFALGGHSLLATQLVSRVRARLGAALPLRAVFESPRLAAMARAVEALLRDGAAPELRPIARVEGNDLPLSFAQERLWFMERLEPGATAYAVPLALRLSGALDPAALRAALGEIVRRHEPLRTVIPDEGGRPVQHVRAPEPFHLPVTDLSGDDDAEESAAAHVTAAALRPMELSAGPLFRAELVRIGRGEHFLSIVFHHVVTDGWSLGIFFRELAVLYEAFLEGRPSPLAPLAIRYADYAAWQREWLTGEVLQRQLGWWRERLAGAPALLPLPTDRPRPAVQSFRGANLRFELTADEAGRAHALARAEGATFFMVLLAAFQAVLARWSGVDDVVVGTPVAGRTRAETEELIGLFVNTLALRGDLSGHPAFRVLLARVREATLGAFMHQDLPFERLVEELHPERSLGHSPVFQVMFSLQNNPSGGGWSIAGVRSQAYGVADAVARFDLTLAMEAKDDGSVSAILEYAADLFDAGTAERFVAHFRTLLAAAVADPSLPVSALPLVAEEERSAVLRLSAAPPAAAPPTVLHAFAARVAAAPRAAAVEAGGERVAYAELHARADRVARLLRARGVRAETPVALFLERSVETAVAWVAVLRSGGFVVPVDPEYPEERIAWMLDDSGARIALTHARLIDRLPSAVYALALDDLRMMDGIESFGHATPGRPASTAATIAVDGAGTMDGIESSLGDVTIEPDSLAFVIYTSGSTGRPKAAALTHANLAGYVAAIVGANGVSADDRVLHRTPSSFDPSVSELWIALAAGATVVMAPPGAHADPGALAREAADRRATVIDVVPSLLAAMLHSPEFARCGDLRLIFCGGEALAPATAERTLALLPHATLVNAYGPAETTITATAAAVSPDEAVTIGVPLPGVRAYVVDARGEPAPLGVPGELCVGGALVGRGYRGRPALTAERFVPDPFAARPGARMYRTGDRARWMAAGGNGRERDGAEVNEVNAGGVDAPLAHGGQPAFALQFLGRTDFQLKLRGQRIEPGEVEAALTADPSVREAVVGARPGANGDPRLVAWVVAAEGRELSVDALRADTARRLPRHLVPAAIVAMDDLPRTPGGKVDRRALPDPEASADGYVEPYTPEEIEMADVWSEVLGVARVGADDDFFALGGHSLLAVQLMARIRERFGRELPLAELFRSPTLSALAGAVRLAGDGGPASTLVALHPAGARPPLFFVHPAGGTVFRYLELARALGADQPFYGVQARGVNDDLAPLERMDEMVEAYAAAIRAAFPHGPYFIGGWSAGGPVAFALAARLRELGEDAPLAIVLDAVAPGHLDDEPEPDNVYVYLRVAYDLVGVDEAAATGLEAELRALPPAARDEAMAAWIARSGVTVPPGMMTQIGRTARVWMALEKALDHYRPPRFDGDLLLVAASEGATAMKPLPGGLAAGWEPYVGGRMEVRTVPGTHAQLVLDPAAAEVAAAVRAAVDAVLARRG